MTKKKTAKQDPNNIIYSGKRPSDKKVTAKDVQTADNIVNFIKRADPPYFKNEGTPLMSVSLKRLADYLALDVYPKGTEIVECGNIFEQKIIAASYEEILTLWKYIRRMTKKIPRYGFSEALIITSINAREDKTDIFERVCQVPGFKRLKTQNPCRIFG